jgi:hypothetical protein
MGRSIPVRLLLATALAAGTLTVISVASPSGAATKVYCTKEVSAKPSATTGTIKVTAKLSGCVGLSATANNVSTVNTKTAKATAKTTWAGGKGTTLQSVKYVAQKTLGKCPAGSTGRILVTATTTGGSGAALKKIPKGSVGKSSICTRKDSTGILEPGTKATF